eukprot:g81465.t1
MVVALYSSAWAHPELLSAVREEMKDELRLIVATPCSNRRCPHCGSSPADPGRSPIPSSPSRPYCLSPPPCPHTACPRCYQSPSSSSSSSSPSSTSSSSPPPCLSVSLELYAPGERLGLVYVSAQDLSCSELLQTRLQTFAAVHIRHKVLLLHDASNGPMAELFPMLQLQAVQLGLHFLLVRDTGQAVRQIRNLLKKAKPLASGTEAQSKVNMSNAKVDALSQVPGISNYQANQLLSKFGTLQQVFNASTEQLTEISGGPTVGKAEKMRTFLQQRRERPDLARKPDR